MRPPLLPGGLVALLLLLPAASATAELRGRAAVTDGDTIEVAGETVRRFGIFPRARGQAMRRYPRTAEACASPGDTPVVD